MSKPSTKYFTKPSNKPSTKPSTTYYLHQCSYFSVQTFYSGCAPSCPSLLQHPSLPPPHPRSSSANAAVAFAVATAGSSNPRDLPTKVGGTDGGRSVRIQAKNDAFRASAKRKMSITSSAATMRVLSVLRHWVTKHGQVGTT